MTSQRLYQLKVLLNLRPFDRNFKGKFWGSPICGVWGIRASGVVPIESPTTSQYLSIQSFALPAAVWLQFHVKLWPPIRLSVCGVSKDLGSREWYQSKCRPYILIRLLSIHTIDLSCTVWSQYTTCRQNDRNRSPIMYHWRPNYSKLT